MNAVADIRKDYRLQSLNEKDVSTNPFNQFEQWWQQALDSEIDEINAMTLCTVDAKGRPQGRIVLLKGFDQDGFVFFTNYQSHKGNDLTHTPYATLVFFWKELERQVRISGVVSKVDDTESDQYFLSRPVKSQIGAWASPQSQTIKDRSVLDENLIRLEEKFEKEPIYRPPHWGGFRVKPESIEFWQGRSSRLHDRIFYTKNGNDWKIERLAP